MRDRSLPLWSISTLLLILLAVANPRLYAQSLTQGGINGTVTDSSGAVIPNASVELKSTQTGATQTRTTNSTGGYQFPLLNPGPYTITYTAPSYASTTRSVQVT